MKYPHKEHWVDWLAEYDGPGYYSRTNKHDRDAAYVYNHLHCAGMLIWLAEAAGVDPELVARAAALEIKLHGSFPDDARQVRRILTWDRVRAALRR